MGFSFLIYRAVTAILGGHYEELTHPSFLMHLVGASSLAVLWLVCRTGTRSVATVRAVETFAIFGAVIGYSLMSSSIPAWQMPHYISLLALEALFVARAIYVPSSALRSLVLTTTAGAPFLAATYVVFREVDTSNWVHVSDAVRAATGEQIARSQTVFAGLWWVVTIALSAGASKVIYGLRKSVHSARKLGQYELVEKLGEGGMGVVYRAEHAMLRRPTAVKLLRPDQSGEKSIARFEKEVRQTARLSHPNTVTIFDYGRTPDGTFYYAMELMQGGTLTDVVEVDGPQDPSRVIRVIECVAQALAEAHGIGLIHRDIKPSNIMLVRQGGELDVPKVLDFGLVKELTGGEVSVTHAGAIAGTPQYMPPEAITEPERVDGRSDIYALGAVAYYLLAGHHVFQGSNVVEVCSHHLHTEPPPFERDVPAELAAIVMRCLAKDPDDRPQSATELAALLAACGVARWTAADGARWWSQHGGAVRERLAAQALSSSGHTLDIDMASRSLDPAIAVTAPRRAL